MTIVEAKGRCRAEAIARNEILTGINSPKQYILAIVEVEDGQS